jgi:hypothetical protein
MRDKALRLLKSGRVERLDNNRYNVIGDHGTYTVVQTRFNHVSCNCLGFQNRGRCSHSMAVRILTSKKR